MIENSNQIIREVGQRFLEEHHSHPAVQYVSGQLLLTRGVGKRYDEQFSSGDPFQVRNLHLALVIGGSIDNTVNLLPRHLEKGDLLLMTPDSILTQTGRSDDFDMQVLQLSPDYVADLFRGSVPPVFSHRMRDFILKTSGDIRSVYRSLLDSLWGLLHTEICTEAAVDACVMALLQFVREMTLSQMRIQKAEGTHNLVLFNRFIDLVNEYCDEHREVSFYADAIGLTKQYLGSVITAASGKTASTWIDEALLSRIKILLIHSDLTSAEISERLSFPAPSHFARFFKRLTGLTPKEYRKRPSNDAGHSDDR